MANFTYTFPAVVGTQNGRVYYQATVPFRALGSLLKLDDDFDVNKRSQRLVDKSRGNKVADYLNKNKEGFFVIPPLVGVIEGEFSFNEVPLDGFINLGNMEVSLDAKVVLFDGQHRAFGIRSSLALCSELAHHSVSIMFFADMSLAQRKQAFHDINHTQKTPAAALCIAYNDRSDYDKQVVKIVSESSIRGFIEYEKNAVSGNNENLYSLKTFKDFFINLVGKSFDDQSLEFATQYVDELFKNVNMPAWSIANPHLATPKKLRELTVVGHGVMLQAFGLLGKALALNNELDWREKLTVLANSDLWYKDDSRWAGRCVNEKGRMISNKLAVRLTYYELKNICGVPLTPEEKIEERREIIKII